MKKNSRRGRLYHSSGLLVLTAALMLFPASGKAETLRGEVLTLNENGRSFRFRAADPSGSGVSEAFDIRVLQETRFIKINSLNDLAAGDEVRVEAEKNSESGMWEAGSVEILKVQLYQTLAGSNDNPGESPQEI